MIATIYRGLGRLLEYLLILAMALLVFDVLWGVASRMLGTFRAWVGTHGINAAFLPSGQSPWTEELARFLLIWVGMLGAALAFQRSGHLGVDYFVGKLHEDSRRWMRVFTWLVILFFAGSILCDGGWSLVQRTLEMGQETPALGIRKGWVYLAVPLSGAFILLFGVVNLFKCLRGESLSLESESDYEP
ncbi:MAG: 2,3-diketo-L-gulonate transporter small permease protein YiaM [Verrucomicrobiota bacterium]|jgi:TRAP-type C4-dicarboxylate transport system permease small subunit